MAIEATGSEDAWQRECLIEVTSGSTKIIRLTALTETVDIDNGERDLDKIDLVNIGQIPKHGAVGITTITFEGYPLQAGTATTSTGTGMFDMFASNAIIDSGQPLDIDLSATLTKYRVAILWTEDTGPDDASDATATSKKAMRYVIAECFCTSCKTDFTDGILKQTLVFKGPGLDKVKNANIKMESNDSSASGGIPALGNYVPGATKWA